MYSLGGTNNDDIKIMSKYINLLLFLLVAAFTACNDESSSIQSKVKGERVELNMSFMLGEMASASSRALGEYSQYTIGNHPSLWVVVFDENGYLVEWAKATDQQFKSGASLNETEFKVTLHGTSEPRILHFLANYADELTLEYGHESNVIGSMMVGERKDVYWQRIESSEGINDKTTFQRIPLLRNFAKVTIVNDFTNFQLEGFYVLNPPKYGMVAPFSNGEFVNYLKATETTKSYFELLADGYTGTTPATKEYDIDYAESKWLTANSPFYTYENSFHQDAKETVSILIKGRYRSNASTSFNNVETTYYHVDMVYEDENTHLPVYFHVLRNFHYEYHIKSINGVGKSNPQEAISSPAGNNLVGSVLIKDMPNISNGEAAMYVQYTDTVLVTDNTIYLKYKFTDNVNMEDTSPSYHLNEQVNLSFKGDAVFNDYKFLSKNKDADGNYILLDTNVNKHNELYVDEKGWGVIVLYPNTSGDYTQTQTLTIANVDTRLSRDVVFQMRPKLTCIVDCTEQVPDIIGQNVTVRILLPDELNENLFPLDFSIESDDTGTTNLLQYLSPKNTEEISIKTGNSIVKNGSLDFTAMSSFQYIKKLTYEQYSDLSTETVNGVSYRVFPCYFVTNIANSASTIYVYNKYFRLASDSFTNFEAARIISTMAGEQYYGSGKSVTISFTTNTTGRYRIEVTEGSEKTIEYLDVNNTNGNQMVTYNTKTWNNQINTKIIFEDEYVEYELIGDIRNVLFIKPVGILDAGNNTEIRINSGNKVTSTTWSSTTSLGTKSRLLDDGYDYVKDNLAENAIFYLCYRTGNNNWNRTYYNSQKLTAGDLAGSNLTVTFTKN